MADTQRLADLVVARRVQLGHKRRPALAEAAGISLRTLSDIEAGRRTNYDPATLAAVENTLGWQTGSIRRILDGGQPIIIAVDQGGATDSATIRRTDRDQLIISIMERDDISDDQKRHIAEILIAQREAAERAREESARRMVDLVKRHPGD